MDELEKKAQELLEKGFAKNLQEAKAMAEKLVDEKVATVVKSVTEAFEAKLKEQNESHKSEIGSMVGKMDERDKLVEKALTDMNRIKEQEKKERIATAQSDIYDALGEHQEKMNDFVRTKKSFEMEMKAVGSIGVAANSVAPEFQAPVGVAHELVHARNTIPVSPTSSNLIKYIQFTKKDGSIATVAAGASKPQFDFTQTVKDAAVRKIAGYVTVHDEFLEDTAGSRDFLATELPQALLDAEDAQIFKGNNTGENLNGLYTQATALALPKGTVTTASNRWDKIAAGLTQVRRNLRGASAIWISPEDYLELLINKDDQNAYTYPIIANAAGQITVGGVPVYQHSIFAAGEGLVGDFVRGTRIFQKMGMVIKFSTEHADNFITNSTTVLIEERIALPVYFPESFVKLDLTITPAV
jgi:HK97 family phage major capsid protein